MKPDHSINMDRGTLSGLLNYSAMNRDAIYRRSAAFAQRRADRAVNADDREEWRRIAQGWLALLRKRPMTPNERFETVANRLGTGQKESQ
jgi:hypothetical protein